MSAAVIILAKQKRYIRAFREANAIDESRAVTLSEICQKPSFIYQRLVKQGVIDRAGNDRYYLDEVKEEELRKRRKKLTSFLLFLFVLGMIIGYLASR